MKCILSPLSVRFEYLLSPRLAYRDSEALRCRPDRAWPEVGRRIGAAIVLAAALLAGPLTQEAQAGPTVTLTYQGYVEGVLSTAVLQFEDLRLLGGSPSGFYFSLDGRLCWQRVNPIGGQMYVGGYVSNALALYYLSDGTISGTSDWGYVTIVPTVGSTFLGRIDLTSDANLVYIDQFALTANPLGPGTPTTYYFSFDVVATPAISPNGGDFSGPVAVTLACPTAGATIYYMTNGTTPTTSSAVYSGPFVLTASATVKTKGVKLGLTDSAVASTTFNVTSSAPSLTFTRSGNSFIVAWPLSAQGYVLESAGTLTGTNQWSVAAGTLTTNGLFLQMTTAMTGNTRFFRLKK